MPTMLLNGAEVELISVHLLPLFAYFAPISTLVCNWTIVSWQQVENIFPYFQKSSLGQNRPHPRHVVANNPFCNKLPA